MSFRSDRSIVETLRPGSIVPVAPGRMRNIWSADGRAKYVPWRELRQSQDKIVERDRAFGMKREEMEDGQAEEVKAATTSTVKLLSVWRFDYYT